MKLLATVALAALWAQQATAHATFQQLWVDGVDYGSQCARIPTSNSPVTDVSSSAIRCNAGSSRPSVKCPVKAGGTVTVEMHQQPSTRTCTTEAIGGAHHGPVLIYLSRVPDATTADGSTGWFKIFQDSWAKNGSSSASGDADYWGTKDLNTCCGRMDLRIPGNIAPGDYLLRAEAIALHAAGGKGGAQFYVTCFQIVVSGGGGDGESPATVSFPGAYKAEDKGILVDIHAAMEGYEVPGPGVYAGGSTRAAGSECKGCEASCVVGSAPSATLSQPVSTGTTGPGAGSGCAVARYQQCGGTGYTGCVNCESGSTCSAVSPPYYSQCV